VVTGVTIDTICQFHQRSIYSFYASGAQKHKRDSEAVNLYTLLGTPRVKAVDER